MVRIKDERTCCGVVEDAKYRAREKRANRAKPQPWIVLKFAVGLTTGIIAYASYVYIGRFCVPMLLKNDGALGGQAMGVAFLVIFSLLLVMITWTYIKVVFTAPGHAKNHVQKSPQPEFPTAPPPRLSWESDDIGGTEYTHPPPRERSRADSHSTRQSMGNGPTSEKPATRRGSTSRSGVSIPSVTHQPPRQNSRKLSNEPDVNASVLDALPVPVQNLRDLEEGRAQATQNQKSIPDLPPPELSRRPPTRSVLMPGNRYCYSDEIVKPVRAHHCRACGTCILKYDHHCPWVGQCVGARNHKFFVNFVMWAALYCLWIFTTMLGLVAPEASKPDGDIDAQKIVIIAVAGFFALFTSALFVSHVHLISLNQSTVESMGFRAMKDRERGTLAELHPWNQCGDMARTKRNWDAEWGRPGLEGNIWWLGGRRQNWEAVMGKNIWWWFLPIGRSESDGLKYPINPRFDPEGRWRRRAEWPLELR